MHALPIHALIEPLREAFSCHNQVILEAPTGAGKSTALPLAMLDWPEIRGKILMLEPRRVAARSVAHFVAKCRQQAVGQEVGYRVRGDNKVSRDTRLEIVTEGILTRMIQQDPELTGVELIIFDEIHERHLTTDLGLALALEVQGSLRDDLKILAMSATLSGLPLAQVMPEALTLTSEGRSFPVSLSYSAAKDSRDWLTHMGRTILTLLQSRGDDSEVNEDVAKGSMLAFLPGKGEILTLQQYLSERLPRNDIDIFPLFGELNASEQDKAIAPCDAGRRKLVLATNVAESSLTIAGITLVVDSGYKRQASFNPRTGTSRLELKRISQASATQRAGRAGRLTSGHCVRLWSQEEQGRLLKADEPEIVLADLISLAHDAAYWGAKSLSQLALMTAPPSVNEQLAWGLLQSLDLVDADNKLTSHGRDAYALGCHPRLAHMLLHARALGERQQDDSLATLACLLATILEARGLPRLGADIGDYLRLASQGMMASQAKQWQKKLAVTGDLAKAASYAHSKDIGLLLALAYPDRIAKARGIEGYQLANGTGVTLPLEDALGQSPWLVVADFQELAGQRAGKVYLAARFESSLLDSQLASLVNCRDVGGWDESKGRFIAERHERLGQILLKATPISEVAPSHIIQAIVEQVRIKGLSLLAWDDNIRQLQCRVAILQRLDPDNPWPDIQDDSLLASIETWLAPYLTGVNRLSQLQKIDCFTAIRNLMSWELQQRLDNLLPQHWPLATGTNAPIRFTEDGRALLSVRLQEAFGLQQSPVLAQGKLNVTMELLSPAHRPLAVTADLASFWQGPYVDVKKEMRGRYPKHLWPDSPATTLPTKFTKKKTLGLAK